MTKQERDLPSVELKSYVDLLTQSHHRHSSQGGFGHYDVSRTVFSSLIVISLMNVSSLISHKMVKQTPKSVGFISRVSIRGKKPRRKNLEKVRPFKKVIG